METLLVGILFSHDNPTMTHWIDPSSFTYISDGSFYIWHAAEMMHNNDYYYIYNEAELIESSPITLTNCWLLVNSNITEVNGEVSIENGWLTIVNRLQDESQQNITDHTDNLQPILGGDINMESSQLYERIYRIKSGVLVR